VAEGTITLTEENFDETLSSELPVVVDFWASWCGPCKMLAPVIEEIAGEYAGKAVIAKCNVDESLALAERFGIMSVPAILFFKGGELVEKLSGYRTKSQIAAVLENTYKNREKL